MNPPNCLVFLVDDDPSVRKGIKPLLLSQIIALKPLPRRQTFLCARHMTGPRAWC